jgi:toxin FitB
VIVVDTNVTSEVMRREPAAAVLAWLAEQPPGDLYSTAITVAEIGYGVARLPDGQRRELLRATASEVFSAFSDRILSFDARAAAYYAEVVVEAERSGAPISGFDAQIASICLSHGATLATRNVKDFDGVGIALRNPWVWQ